MTSLRLIIIFLTVCGLAACSGSLSRSQEDVTAAPGAPGDSATWSNAEKIAIGTSYEAYDADGAFSSASATAPISKVWFSLGKDRVTEVMWGLIHEAQIREIRFLLVGPEGIVAPTRVETVIHPVDVVRAEGVQMPRAPETGFRLHFSELARTVLVSAFADPDRDTLIVRTVAERGLPAGYDLVAYIDPALANTGSGDRARVISGGLHAFEGNAHLFARLEAGAEPQVSVGFVGVSDGLANLAIGRMSKSYRDTGDQSGNVAGTMKIMSSEGGGDQRKAILSIGFGASFEAAKRNADATIASGPQQQYQKYVQQWGQYLGALSGLKTLAAAAEDGGHLAYMSALNLKIMEDKTHAGALIASLSNPWGETAPADQPQTGYKAVWPRDFFQVASAFLAMGDADTARAAYRYLPTVQVTADTPGNAGVSGWFLQKTHVDGEIEWVAIQQDQTAMPIMLGWQLWQQGVLSDEDMATSYDQMLKPAADFLVHGGRPSILWNTEFEARLGYTQQERWEEQEGYSPSTVAAVISGLVAAADLAVAFGDPADAQSYLAAADQLEANLEAWMFTTSGTLGDGEYFVRITQNQDPNDKAQLGDNNGRPGLPEDQILDGGVLELVRYGVRSWDAPSVLSTVLELDRPREDNLRVRYEFGDGVIGWRRYGNDGYGEDGERGTNYHEIGGGNTPGQRGRVWPFFSGERAHYEIARLNGMIAAHGSEHPDVAIVRSSIRQLIKSMEAFANDGLALPEQVWDGVGPNPFEYELGEGTNSATPLAWTHAEYIKLLRSAADQRVWDRYPIVAKRYSERSQTQPSD
ncbi:MAG: glycoside hydrolase family 15 protein [Pseudomonadota bacterium]